jgi:hypothetical protein
MILSSFYGITILWNYHFMELSFYGIIFFMDISFYDEFITEMSKANRSITTNNVKSIYIGASLPAPTILWFIFL